MQLTFVFTLPADFDSYSCPLFSGGSTAMTPKPNIHFVKNHLNRCTPLKRSLPNVTPSISQLDVAGPFCFTIICIYSQASPQCCNRETCLSDLSLFLQRPGYEICGHATLLDKMVPQLVHHVNRYEQQLKLL